MWTMRMVIVGLALAFWGGVGEAPAQILLRAEQPEEMDQQIDGLRARARCYEEQAAARQQGWNMTRLGSLTPAATAERDAQLRQVDAQLQGCLDQLQAPLLRQACRAVARTESQRARCQW